MTILIISHTKDDDVVKPVLRQLIKLGCRGVRLDIDNYPDKTKLSYGMGRGVQSELTNNGEPIQLAEVEAVWCRRRAFRDELSGPAHGFYGMLAATGAFQVDPLHVVGHAQNPFRQMQVAVSAGLEVPQLLVSNQRDKITAFTSQNGGRVYSLSDQRVLDLEAINHWKGPGFPVMFQEVAEVRLILRATIVGHRVFCVGENPNALLDSTDEEHLGHPYHLPHVVETALLKFMSCFQLNVGEVRLVLTPDERFVFQEMNPGGDFHELEVLGLNAAHAMAELLAGLAPRRNLTLHGA